MVNDCSVEQKQTYKDCNKYDGHNNSLRKTQYSCGNAEDRQETKLILKKQTYSDSFFQLKGDLRRSCYVFFHFYAVTHNRS